jgi:hypothetical protein
MNRSKFRVLGSEFRVSDEKGVKVYFTFDISFQVEIFLYSH